VSETEIVSCESCDKPLDDETSWRDSEGVELCPPCAYEHLSEVIKELRNAVDELTDPENWVVYNSGPHNGLREWLGDVGYFRMTRENLIEEGQQ
jgi:hypothetical protein